MLVNVPFLVVAYIVGLFIDWVFQWQWQAEHKSQWLAKDGYGIDKKLSFMAVTSHSLIYAFFTSLITLVLIGQLDKFWLVFLVLFITHTIIDTRIPVKYIMRMKGLTWDQIYDYKTFSFMHIGIDHRMHEAVFLILSMLV